MAARAAEDKGDLFGDPAEYKEERELDRPKVHHRTRSYIPQGLVGVGNFSRRFPPYLATSGLISCVAIAIFSPGDQVGLLTHTDSGWGWGREGEEGWGPSKEHTKVHMRTLIKAMERKCEEVRTAREVEAAGAAATAGGGGGGGGGGERGEDALPFQIKFIRSTAQEEDSKRLARQFKTCLAEVLVEEGYESLEAFQIKFSAKENNILLPRSDILLDLERGGIYRYEEGRIENPFQKNWVEKEKEYYTITKARSHSELRTHQEMMIYELNQKTFLLEAKKLRSRPSSPSPEQIAAEKTAAKEAEIAAEAILREKLKEEEEAAEKSRKADTGEEAGTGAGKEEEDDGKEGREETPAYRGLADEIAEGNKKKEEEDEEGGNEDEDKGPYSKK